MANRASLIDAEVRAQHANATLKRRGRNFIEHDLGGGVTRWTGAIEPLHTRAGAEIDTAWVADASPWSYRIAAADYVARIKASFSSAPLLQYTDVETGATVSLQPMALNWTNDINQIQQISAVQGVTAQLADDLVRWPGAYGAGRDFVYINHPERLIKHLVLQSALPEPKAYILDGANPCLQLQFMFNWSTDATVWIDGAQLDKRTAKVTANRIEFRVGDAPVFWFDAPTAWDANGDAAAGVVLRVRKAGNNLYVEVRTPYTWLQGAQYPVVVDPTLTAQPDSDAGKDTRIKENAATKNYGDLEYIEVASYDVGDTTNALLQFDVSSIPSGAEIDTAVLTLTTSLKISDFTMALYRVLVSWTESGVTWNSRDGTNNWSTAGCQGSGTDHAASATESGVASHATANTFSVAGDVQAWVDGTSNYGWVIDPDSAPSGDYILYHSCESSTAASRPKLVVDYTYTPPTGSPWYAYAQM